MAHNSRAKASWSNGDELSATRVEALDANGYVAVNGDAGGVWAPSAPIEIRGSGVLLALSSGGGTVASLVALANLVSMTNYQVCFVFGYGMYIYVDPDATAASEPWIVEPGAGTGRWYHSSLSLRNNAYGIVGLDASAKVPIAQLRNQIIATGGITAEQGPLAIAGVNTLTSIPGASVALSGCIENDIVMCQGTIRFSCTTIDTGFDFVGALTMGDTPVSSPQHPSRFSNAAVYKALIPISFRYVCTAADETAGSVTVLAQAMVDATSSYAGNMYCDSLTAMLIRP